MLGVTRGIEWIRCNVVMWHDVIWGETTCQLDTWYDVDLMWMTGNGDGAWIRGEDRWNLSGNGHSASIRGDDRWNPSQVLAVTGRSVAYFIAAGPTSLQYGRIERGVRGQFLDGFVHSKLHNCLTEDAVEKLVYIKTNNIQFCNQTGLAADLNADNEDDEHQQQHGLITPL
jgi:hypothetical protein